MRERPIIFSAPMVRAILAGTKTQTRRVIKSYQLETCPGWYFAKVRDAQVAGWRDGEPIESHMAIVTHCPYGGVGDRLWVRETWIDNHGAALLYRADYGPGSFEYDAKGWRPSIHMPRSASRITLEITNVRVERVQDIPEVDDNSRVAFAVLWDSINGARASWDANPWCWCISFRRLAP